MSCTTDIKCASLHKHFIDLTFTLCCKPETRTTYMTELSQVHGTLFGAWIQTSCMPESGLEPGSSGYNVRLLSTTPTVSATISCSLEISQNQNKVIWTHQLDISTCSVFQSCLMVSAFIICQVTQCKGYWFGRYIIIWHVGCIGRRHISISWCF